MHLTLKKEATKPAAANVLQQQARFDAFLERYNQERPHQALGMKVPADVYARSPRLYRGLEELTYPFHDQTIAVTRCGRIGGFNRLTQHHTDRRRYGCALVETVLVRTD